ncbi:MAG: glycosyltransferase [Acidobacteriia bacterium]|nr:glycosyltransferase [Terriglobia bacterium]
MTIDPTFGANFPGTQFRGLRVAIVHYWLLGYAGGERVVSALLDIFPQADLFAVFADEQTSARFAPHRVTTSFLQKIPGSHRFHRQLLPLIPLALEQFDLREYDLVISSESGPAKGVLTSTQTLHINYCHSPMRYIWELYHEYINGKDMAGLTRKVFMGVSHYMRMWDLASAARVDFFVANSNNVAARIRKNYRRDAVVIHPPVNVAGGYVSDAVDDYYLAVGRLVDYKRMDLAVEACTRLGRPLRVVGDGPQYKRLRQSAGPSVQFLGELTDIDLSEQYAHCRALLFPGKDDFGIVPVEAQAFGRPVLAFGRGGALETVKSVSLDDVFHPEISTGILFNAQNSETLANTILEFESIESEFSPEAIRCHAQQFDVRNFQSRMKNFISACLEEHRELLEPVEQMTSLSAG